MKEIDGFPGYFVTREGKVYSTKKYRDNPKGELREMSQRTDRQGYKRVEICGRDRKKFGVHRLVAEAYIPNPENFPQVNHINEDKSDNNVSNLMWMNNSDNSAYSNSKLYILENKNGEQFEVFNLQKWCRENSMDSGSLAGTLKGITRKWHKDHRIVSKRELTNEERQQRLLDAMISETSKDSRRVSA